MSKLFNMYSVVSNKTVRKHEKKYDAKTDKPRNKFVLGHLVKTNRGYFIDGNEVDTASVNLYRACNASPETAKPYYDAWQSYVKAQKEAKKA